MVDIFFLGARFVAIFCKDDHIAVVPLLNTGVAFQRIRGAEAVGLVTKPEHRIIGFVAEKCLLGIHEIAPFLSLLLSWEEAASTDAVSSKMADALANRPKM